MATHSYGLIPTLRTPGEYMLSEGWSDGMLDWTGWSCFKSSVRLTETIEATKLLGGSPCFVFLDSVEIKEGDYLLENFMDDIDMEDPSVASVQDLEDDIQKTFDHLEANQLDEAKKGWLGTLTLEDHLRISTGLNLVLFNGLDQEEVAKTCGLPVHEFLSPSASATLLAQKGVMVVGTTYYLDANHQWWASVDSDGTHYWVPLCVTLYFSSVRQELLDHLAKYPDAYPHDIPVLNLLQATYPK